MIEKDFAKYVVEYLNYLGYDLYYEVKTHGANIIDIVGKRDNVITAFELKTSLSIAVIEQAYRNKWYSHYSYIVVPTKTRHRSTFSEKICKDYGLGVILFNENTITYSETFDRWIKNYTPSESFRENVYPSLNRKPILPILQNYMKDSIPGSQCERITSFKNMVNDIVKAILRRSNNKIHIDDAFGYQTHYENLSGLKRNLYQWCRNGVITEFYIDKGFIYLAGEEK